MRYADRVDFLIVLAYLAAIIAIGRRAAARRKSGGEDYILAGRTLTMPTFVATLVTSFYGGVLGVGEYTYLYGLSNWLIQGVPYYLFALLYALFLAPRVRRRPGLTIADHLEEAYGKPMAALGALLVFILTSPADTALMLGTLLRWMTGWSLWICTALAMLAAVSLIFTGGLRSEAWAGRLEFVLMFCGFALILPFCVSGLGGPAPGLGGPAWNPGAIVHGFGQLRERLPPGHLSWTGGHSAWYILSWFFIALWTFVDPTFHQRVCAARDVATARRGIALSVLFWFLFDFMTTSAGLYARAMLPGLDSPMTAFPALAARLLPPVVRGLFFAGMLSSILADLSAKSFLSAVSLAKDGVGRLYEIPSRRLERSIQWGLVATGILSVLLAVVVPSVVGLWYIIGSTTIPGLLVVLLTGYFKRLRVPPRAATLCSLSGWLASLGAWALKHPAPFYPGILASVLVWATARAFLKTGPEAAL